MKMLLLFIMFFIFILCTGCAPKVEYVTKVVEVEKKVPVYPEVPEIECDFYKATPEEILNSVYECVIIQKRFIDSLRATTESK